MVSGSISLLCSRFFSPFLHSTGSLSVSREYLALRDGPRGFTQNFSCSGLLRILLSMNIDSNTRLSLSLARLSNRFFFAVQVYIVVLQPRICRNIFGLGCSAFARHYLRNHYYFLFLRVLRCFSSPGWLGFSTVSLSRWVAPFGYPRIKGYLHLPVAFRSLSRPSSPPRAKASSIRPLLLSFSRIDTGLLFGSILIFVFCSFLSFYIMSKILLWRITDSNR